MLGVGYIQKGGRTYFDVNGKVDIGNPLHLSFCRKTRIVNVEALNSWWATTAPKSCGDFQFRVVAQFELIDVYGFCLSVLILDHVIPR